MGLSRLLVMCALLALAYAQVQKSERIKISDACDTMMAILHVSTLDSEKYMNCGGEADDFCYEKAARCDGVLDCPNMADERDCKVEHQVDCDTAYTTKPGQPFRCTPMEGADPDDRICIVGAWRCNGEADCPNGDDEQGCPPSE